MKKHFSTICFILFIIILFISCSNKKINKSNNAGYFKEYRDAIDFIEAKGFDELASVKYEEYEGENVINWIQKYPYWIDGLYSEERVMSLKRLMKTKGYFVVLLYDSENKKWNQALLLNKEFISTWEFWDEEEVKETWGDSWIRAYYK